MGWGGAGRGGAGRGGAAGTVEKKSRKGRGGEGRGGEGISTSKTAEDPRGISIVCVRVFACVRGASGSATADLQYQSYNTTEVATRGFSPEDRTGQDRANKTRHGNVMARNAETRTRGSSC